MYCWGKKIAIVLLIYAHRYIYVHIFRIPKILGKQNFPTSPECSKAAKYGERKQKSATEKKQKQNRNESLYVHT